MGRKQAAIYSADTWHLDDGVSTDGSGRPLHHKGLSIQLRGSADS